MALDHNYTEFSVDEAGIYSLATDPTGAPATYGSLILLVGIQTVSLTMEMLDVELFGDGVVMDEATRVRKCSGTATFSKNGLDSQAVQLGGTVTDAGTTPNQIASYDLAQANFPSWFKLVWRVKQTSVTTGQASDARHTVFKCRATGFTKGGAAEQFAAPSFNFVGVYLNGTATINGVSRTKPLYAEEERETGAALS